MTKSRMASVTYQPILETVQLLEFQTEKPTRLSDDRALIPFVVPRANLCDKDRHES